MKNTVFEEDGEEKNISDSSSISSSLGGRALNLHFDTYCEKSFELKAAQL